MPFTPKLTYKGKPLVRKDNELYYGRMTDPYVLRMQILSTNPWAAWTWPIRYTFSLLHQRQPGP